MEKGKRRKIKQEEWERKVTVESSRTLTSRMFREPDSLNDGLHLKLIYKRHSILKLLTFYINTQS